MISTTMERAPRHPGRILQEDYLSRLPESVTQAEIADRLGMSAARLCKLLRGNAGISPDTALRLARAFGTTPELWLKAQAAWDLCEARRSRKLVREIGRIEPLLDELEDEGEEAEVLEQPGSLDLFQELAALATRTREDQAELDPYLRRFLDERGLLAQAHRFMTIQRQIDALSQEEDGPARRRSIRVSTSLMYPPPAADW